MNQYWGEKKILFVVVVIVLFFFKNCAHSSEISFAKFYTQTPVIKLIK